MTSRFAIRPARIDEAPIIARHRADMFADMGQLPPGLRDALVAETAAVLDAAMRSGEYVHWFATSADRPGDIVAGGGVQVRRRLPRPATTSHGGAIAPGREGLVLNVFTERGWRRQGLAREVMLHIVQWARTTGLDSLVLHASDEGRPLYAALGFVQTNEMRYAKPLR